ncbi:MAG: hypothetical protein FWD43_05350, partial [Coriobacteriia bacterium]|nr:hypothetical protein [Coriobacteriia bacterium]
TILIGDMDDKVVAEQFLVDFDEEKGLTTTGSFNVQIPREPGEYTWAIVFYPLDSNPDDPDIDADLNETDEFKHLASDKAPTTPEELLAPSHAIVQIDYRFKAIQHITGMTVWRDSFEPVPVGNEYLLNIGVSCIHGCSLIGQTVNVYCNGALLASAVMEEPIAPLEGLYQHKLALIAPSDVGLYTLECHLEPQGLELSHASDVRKYSLAANMLAQCRLDLQVFNEEDGPPIEKATVVVRPKDGYPGFTSTDAEGKASISVPWGDIYVGINRRGYLEVEKDISIPENLETYELTVKMLYDPSLLG